VCGCMCVCVCVRACLRFAAPHDAHRRAPLASQVHSGAGCIQPDADARPTKLARVPACVVQAVCLKACEAPRGLCVWASGVGTKLVHGGLPRLMCSTRGHLHTGPTGQLDTSMPC